jgi:protocatechuate 3,4-dioxygenase alpha subunit
MKKNTFLQTSSQTVGPFFAYGLTAQQYRYDFPSLFNGNLRKNDIDGKEISIKGRVLDGKGNPLHDAMIEIW